MSQGERGARGVARDVHAPYRWGREGWSQGGGEPGAGGVGKGRGEPGGRGPTEGAKQWRDGRMWSGSRELKGGREQGPADTLLVGDGEWNGKARRQAA